MKVQKVVHIGYKYGLSDVGGAAIASSRLHGAFLKQGVESHYICIHALESGENVHVLPKWRWSRRLYFIITRVMRFLIGKIFHQHPLFLNLLPLPGLQSLLEQIDPDVIHIHWIVADVMSMRQLARINILKSGKRPKVIINLHDLWMINAIDPHPFNDCRYIEGFNRDNSSFIERFAFERKEDAVRILRPCFIGPSEWVCSRARASLIARGCRCAAVSNLIDERFFLNLEPLTPHEDYVILFGAFGGRQNTHKGYKDLVAALELLPGEVKKKTVLRIFGEMSSEKDVAGVRLVFLGAINDVDVMKRAYVGADVLAFPSVAETQGMTKIEALLCGTPVVTYDRTACAEGITHKKNGWIAKAGDIDGFARGLLYFYCNKYDRLQISDEARHTYDSRMISSRILEAYRNESCTLGEKGGYCYV